MAGPIAVILATLNTKAIEARYLKERILAHGFDCEIIDVSLDAGGRQLHGDDKLVAMERAAERAGKVLSERAMVTPVRVMIGLGGGTGGQIIAAALDAADLDAWKLLITTQAFDTRFVSGLEDAIIIPAIADIEGLNRMTMRVLESSAAVASSLINCETINAGQPDDNTVCLSALGITAQGINRARSQIENLGYECAVFHANGHGGNTMVRLIESRGFCAVLDYTIHELVSLCLDPETQVSSQRFRLPREIPRVMLPGGVNFMTRWRGREFGRDQVPRPQYSHSSEIAHVGLSEDEMAGLGDALANVLSEATRSTTVIIPMGGFSSEDCPGGLLENKPGRAAFAESLMAQANNRLRVVRTDGHINDFAVAELAVGMLRELIDEHQAGRVT